MTTESIAPNLKWLLQFDWRETFIPSLGREPWATVYFDKVTEDENLGIFSALIPNATETKGISKLDQFLKAHQYPNHQQHIQFLRNLQSLRSSSVAHRKGDNYKKIAKTLGLKENNRADVLKKFLLKLQTFSYRSKVTFCNHLAVSQSPNTELQRTEWRSWWCFKGYLPLLSFTAGHLANPALLPSRHDSDCQGIPSCNVLVQAIDEISA